MRTLLVAFLVLVAAPAGAVLIERDLSAAGDGLVTRDTNTGLEWLDPTLTLGLSIQDVVAGAGGWLAAGWRHGTVSEVCGLLGSAGSAPVSCPGSGYLPGLTGQPLLELLGVTRAATGRNYAVEQVWAWIDSGQLELSIDRHLTTGELRTYVSVEPGASPTATTSYTGNLLVRIPEPRVALLVSLAALAGWLWQKAPCRDLAPPPASNAA